MRISGHWMDAITGWGRHQLRVDDVTRGTLELRRGQLRHLARTIEVECPWAVTGDQLLDWTRTRAWSSNDTRRSYRTTLRGFYGWGARAGLVATSPAVLLPRVRPVQPRPKPAPDDVYRPALLAAGEPVRLMMRLAGESGLRACEVAVVHTADLIPDLIGTSLVVHGKGRKDRVVPLTDDLAARLRRLPGGWAFPGQVEGHLSAKWVGRLVNRELPDGWTMHKLRHRAGTRFYRECGYDIHLTAAFLGHSDTKTTMVYVQADAEKMRAAVLGAAA